MKRTHDLLERFEDAGSIRGLIERCIAEANDKIGTVNVLIAGRTGVGKSTLINEIFQGRLASTGQGEPGTQETRRLTKKGLTGRKSHPRSKRCGRFPIPVDLVKGVGSDVSSRAIEDQERIRACWRLDCRTSDRSTYEATPRTAGHGSGRHPAWG